MKENPHGINLKVRKKSIIPMKMKKACAGARQETSSGTADSHIRRRRRRPRTSRPGTAEDHLSGFKTMFFGAAGQRVDRRE